jgi:hypothetical protein
MSFLRTSASILIFVLASVLTQYAQATIEINGAVSDPNGGEVSTTCVSWWIKHSKTELTVRPTRSRKVVLTSLQNSTTPQRSDGFCSLL